MFAERVKNRLISTALPYCCRICSVDSGRIHISAGAPSMQTIENGYRSLSLMYDLGFDRIIVPVVIVAGLVLASVLATESSLLRVPADYFLN